MDVCVGGMCGWGDGVCGWCWVCGVGCVGWGECVCMCGCVCVGVCVCVHFISVLSPLGVTCNAANVKISEFPLPERHASIEMHGIKCDREASDV